MTKKDIFDSGFQRGVNVALWCEIPDIGEEIKIDGEGIIDVTKDNLFDTCMSLCFESEANDRQYSPFEFTAKELNDIEEKKPYDVWNVFETGIYKGFKQELTKRLKGGK